jgi:methionyl-tRNA formyltransferase
MEAPMSIRIVLFGSFYRGFAVLNEMLHGPLKQHIQVVGVVSDDPTQQFISAGKRVWQYGYSPEEANMVRDLATSSNIPLFQGRVKTQEFYDFYESTCKPDVCFMATFGQQINERLFSYPRLGFYNLHPSDHADWPSQYAGPNPFQAMIEDQRESCVVSLHHVDGGFDTGDRVGVSEAVYFPPGCSARDLHKMTSPIAALLVRERLQWLIVAEQTNGGVYA